MILIFRTKYLLKRLVSGNRHSKRISEFRRVEIIVICLCKNNGNHKQINELNFCRLTDHKLLPIDIACKLRYLT